MCKKQSRKEIVEELFQLKSEFSHWTEIRATTIKHLREIADYIDTVSRRLAIISPLLSIAFFLFIHVHTFSLGHPLSHNVLFCFGLVYKF